MDLGQISDNATVKYATTTKVAWNVKFLGIIMTKNQQS
jgi:hypothetical protein